MLGFEKVKEFKEPEDHIAVELDFMAKLCGWIKESLESDETDAAMGYLRNQREFMDDHIMKWVPELCERLKNASESKFYTALAHLTQGFLDADSTLIDELLGTLEADES